MTRPPFPRLWHQMSVKHAVATLFVVLAVELAAAVVRTGNPWSDLGDHLVLAAAIGLVAGLMFRTLVTRPLRAIMQSIRDIDPNQPTASFITLPPQHDHDEMGELTSTLNNLLSGFQNGLVRQAFALARTLEERVADRTAALERANRSVKEGITYAARLQSALLPSLAVLDGIVSEWVVGWHPLDKVSGDFYCVDTFEDKAVVAIMDCTGHGVPGAFMSAVASSVLVRVLHHVGYSDPAQILADLNRMIKANLHQEDGPHGAGSGLNDGLDAAICVIDTTARTVTFAGAGLPLVAQINNVQQTISGDKVSLGYADSPTDLVLTKHTIPYQPGDTFILFTDGIPDQVGGPKRRLLGRQRVEAILAEQAGRSLADMRKDLEERLEAWRGYEPRRDDMTFLAFRLK